MPRLILFILASISFLPAFAVLEITSKTAQEALNTLDDSIAKRQYFIDRRQQQINNLVDSLNNVDFTSNRLLQIAERYTGFNNDSALHYLAMGIDSPKCKDKLPFILGRIMLLPLSGNFNTTAVATYDSIDVESIPEELLTYYYDCGRQMFSYIAAFSAGDTYTRDQYNSRSIERLQQMLEILPQNSLEYKFNLGEYFFLTHQYGKARAQLGYVMQHTSNDNRLRARAAHHLSAIAKSSNDNNAYMYYLALSAIADLSAATREVASLQELGSHLYTMGDVDRAYKYLTEALANAVECGAPLRMIESSRSLPIIEHAKTEQINKKTRTINIIVVILILVVIVLVITMALLYREMKQMRQLQDNLRHANKIKEVYIGQFLNLCSIYMDKLNQFCKIANRKIAAGNVDDLYRLTKSGKFVEEQSQEFYEVFDNAFLHLYPRFVEQVNALLLPEAKISLKDDEILNTDLRILAFIRLGIEESSRIAQVLNYSLNTIYSYRNRIKSRAINRDTFEDDIMKISPEY